MNIKEMRGVALKKALSAKSVAFRYHNKNNNGGNFAIDIIGVFGKDYELSGQYDKEGEICDFRFGYRFQPAPKIKVNNFDHLCSLLLYVVTPTVTKIGEV